jgi:hypothetical protein
MSIYPLLIQAVKEALPKFCGTFTAVSIIGYPSGELQEQKY